MAHSQTSFSLPFHRADKKITALNEKGESETPEQANGIKFERFIFDALPIAYNPTIIEALREEEFSPVKNAKGQDSAQTCCDDQLRRWTKWLEKVGVFLEKHETGLPKITFEISPDFADNAEAFVSHWSQLKEKPVISDSFVLTQTRKIKEKEDGK